MVVLAAVVVGIWVSVSRGKASAQQTVQTAKVERGPIVSSISASGQILSANITNLTYAAKGLVKTVYVKDGDTVKAGQKLMDVTLDPDSQQKSVAAYSSYLSAKNAVDSAKATQYTLQSDMFAKWNTFRTLATGGNYDTDLQRTLPEFHIANDDWLAAEAKYKIQAATVTQSQVALQSSWLSYQSLSSTLTAPQAGTVTNVTYTPGMVIDGTSTVARVAVIKTGGMPLATFNISELDVSKVQPGQQTTIKLDSITDKTFTGTVITVDRIGTVTSNVTNYPVIIQFDTDASDILPNMSATATIITESKDNVLLVPTSAISQQQGQNIVQVMNGKQQLSRTVEIGLQSDSKTEIVSGLSEGDTIVTSSTSATTTTTQGQSVFSGGGFGGAGSRIIGR